MNRRRFVQAIGATGIAAVAGCTDGDFFEVQYSPTQIPPVPENRPNAVYYPSHVEGMEMLGMSGMESMGGMNDSGNMSNMNGPNGSGGMGGMNRSSGMGMEGMPVAGDYQFGLMYSYPHRFWNVNGTERTKTALQDADSLHLMASVWEPKTRMVLPDTGLSVEISQGNDLVSEEVIYPMLSEQMGFHYGANFELPGDGTYTAKLSVGAIVLTVGAMLYNGTRHPPACATTLIVALGLLPSLLEGILIVVAVLVLLVIQALLVSSEELKERFSDSLASLSARYRR